MGEVHAMYHIGSSTSGHPNGLSPPTENAPYPESMDLYTSSPSEKCELMDCSLHCSLSPVCHPPSPSASDNELFAEFALHSIRIPPFHFIHKAFTYHARRQPTAPAVEHMGTSITFSELDFQSDCLATYLRTRRGGGVTPGSRVCLLVQRSIAMVVGILAVLKCGASYVPLDGGIVRDEILRFVLQDSSARLVLALQDFVPRAVQCGVDTVCLEEVLKALPAGSSHDDMAVEILSDPNAEAYVIYTSGTTGRPKGVRVSHNNVTNLLCLYPGNLGMRPGMRVAQTLNVAFDMCAWEVLGSLVNGCTLCIRGKSSADWDVLLKTVDVFITTPSILCPRKPDQYPNIRIIATAGEPCPRVLADRWTVDPTRMFYNSCGPTEVTIVNTVGLHRHGAPVTIGIPTPNNTVYVLNEHRQPVPIGSPGFMWAGGKGVSLGYLNLPDKTAEKFTLDPFLDNGEMMFNTGDLGRWLPDGQLEHLGRADDQVKIKGFRVELAGVSAAMEACPGVQTAVAMLIDSVLWGFICPDNVDDTAIIRAASETQPYYAVPSKLLRLPSLPVTSNGKVDKRHLMSLV